MFRTPTGQTGRDAYMFEATAIANARRDLDERMSRLVDTMIAELPSNAMSARRFVKGDVPIDREIIVDIIDMLRSAENWALPELQHIIKNLS